MFEACTLQPSRTTFIPASANAFDMGQCSLAVVCWQTCPRRRFPVLPRSPANKLLRTLEGG